MRGDIDTIKGDLAKQALTNHASLPLSDFKATLPDLGSAIATAKQQGAKVAPGVLNDLQQRLVAAEGAPGFWPTAAEFISYRSSSAVPALGVNVPDCTDREPTPMKITAVPTPTTASVSSSTYENCRLTLDSAKDNAKINFLITHTAPFLTFEHCLIVYRAGSINLIVALNKFPLAVRVGDRPKQVVPFSGNTLHFENCIFDFSLSPAPPQQGQQITELLLSHGTASVDISIQKPS
jgi:hypothetical protein